MIWNSNLRLLRKRSKCDTTRSIQTTFTIFKQQLEIAWEITYALDLTGSVTEFPEEAFSKIVRKISPATASILCWSTSHIKAIVLHDSVTSWLLLSFVYRVKHPKHGLTAAHKPILIFISISDPVIRCPSVRRMFYAVIIILDQLTSNLWIASNFSLHAEDGRESVYPILFRVCTNDIYINKVNK